MKVLIVALIISILVSSVNLISAQDTNINILTREQSDFLVINPSTGIKQRLGISDWLQTFEAEQLALSPDGGKLAFVAVTVEPSSLFYSRVNILDLNTGNMQSVPPQQFYEEAIGPVWSPDGRYVAYLIGGGGLPGTSVGIFDTQTGTDQRYFEEFMRRNDGSIFVIGSFQNLRWSPDGQHFLVGMQADQDPGVANIIAMFDTEGRNPFSITSASLKMLRAEWLPDSSGIIGVCGISDEIVAFCQVAIGEVPASEAIILHQFSPGDRIRRFELVGNRIVFEYIGSKTASILDLTTGQITALETVGQSLVLDVLTETQVAILDNPPFLSLLGGDAALPLPQLQITIASGRLNWMTAQ